MGSRRVCCVRDRECCRRPRWSIRNHTSWSCDRFRMGGRWFQAWSAVVRIRFPECVLPRGQECPRTPDHPSSTTPGFHCAGGMASDRGDCSSAGFRKVGWNGFLLDCPSAGALFAVWILSGCPRCERHFFPVLRPRLFVSLSRCDKCGLGIHDA